MGVAAAPAGAEETGSGVCPTGWQQGGVSVLVGADPAKAARAVAKEDRNTNGEICAKSVEGNGNTGAGYNVKDDRPEDGTIIVVPTIVCADTTFSALPNAEAVLIVGTPKPSNTPEMRVASADINADGSVCVGPAVEGQIFRVVTDNVLV